MYHGLARLLFFIYLGYFKGWNRRWSGGACLGECWLLTGTAVFFLSFSFLFPFSFFYSFALCLMRVMVGRGVRAGGDKWRRRAGSQGARFWSG